MKMSAIPAIVAILLGLSSARAQTTGQPWHGAAGITETVEQIMARERLLTGPIGPPQPTKPESEGNRFPQQNPDAPGVSQWPPPQGTEQSGLPELPALPQTVGLSFLAEQLSESGFVPPDCNGAVSETQILTIVNGRIKLFNKDGSAGPLNASTNTFFSSVRNGSSTSDPHVRYDRTSGRFFIVMINIASSSNLVLLAVSDGSPITGTSSFTFFQFAHDQVGPAPNHDTGFFADYPTLAVDANAVYVGVNVFNVTGDTVKGTTGFVIRKSDLVGGTLTVTAFRALTDGVGGGPWSPQGADNDDPAATEGYFVGVDFQLFSLLDVRRVSDPGGTPSISPDLPDTVPLTYWPIKQVSAGTANNRRLDALDDRLFAAQVKKNNATGISSLWTAHNIRVGTNGVAATNGSRNASRWYELRNLNTTPVLFQSGTLFDAANVNARGYWIPSVAASGQGHMALGCSYASSVDFAGVALAGRLAGDAAGTTRAATLGVVSSTAYNVEATDGQRWGDFSQVVVDPSDNMTMWTFQEYCNATNSWGMRVLKLLAPPPALPATAAPDSIEVSTSGLNVTITGTPTGGAGFFDPGTGFPRHIAASVSGTGVAVNSVTYVDPTHLVLNLSVAAGATPGPRTITVVNPDSQSATSASGIITITNAGCPLITVAPDTLPSGIAGLSYSQLLAASGGVAPYTFAVTGGALPSGVALSSAGLLAGTPAFGGTYSFTATATDSLACPGSRAYTWVVTGCPQVTLSPAGLPAGIYGSPYSQTITAAGGTAPYVFTVTIGTLPPGLALASSGALTGTPTALGTWNFTVTATDAGACTGNRAYSVSVSPAAGSNTILLAALDSAYTQDFNTLVQAGTSSTLPTGWLFSETGTNANSVYSASDGTANTGDTYSYGLSASAERAYGGLQSGTLTPTLGAIFSNVSGSTIGSLEISYTGEEWRRGALGRPDRLDFQLSTNATSLTTGSWTDVDSLDYAVPDTSGATGLLNGNINQTPKAFTISGLSVPNGGTLAIRWLDFNASTADDGLAVDDFSATPHGVLAPTAPAGTGAAVPDTIRVGQSTLLKVTVTPGTNPASSGLAVAADLSVLGGSPAQQFYDDATHGDAFAGDHIWSYLENVPPGAVTGPDSLPATITDAQTRTGSAVIALFVKPACPPISLTPPPLAAGEVGIPYAQQLSASGGTAPYAYSVVAGSLPPGITLSAAGLLHGTPLASDTFSFSVRALDSNWCGGVQAYGIVVAQGANIVVSFTSTGLWNLLSNPVLAANDSVASLFPAAVSAAFEFVPATGYQMSSRIVNGTGYWLKFAGADTVPLIGETIPAETVAVAEGWNLFGSVSNPVATSALTTLGTAITSDIYGYANGYQVVDTILPARGYWGKFSSAGALVIGAGGPAAAARRLQPVAAPADLALTFTDRLGHSQTLILLPRDAGPEAAARYEVPPAPPEGNFDVRFASQRRAESAPAGQTSFEILMHAVSPPLTLRWSRSGDLERHMSVAFAPDGSGPVTLAGAEGEASVASGSAVEEAVLRVEAAREPASFALFQNYPNPFNPSTTVSFSLQVPSTVFLTVVNVLGERVATLLGNVQMDAGTHELRFDAGGLASGIYYCRLTAFPEGGSQALVATRKMLLLR